ncbi:transforming growth factor-beta receptor-associated 1 isoform X1 [Chlorella sorokiniana]|uniref:Transforming growth factor-beta receptor-associated 1 isoform X1 n=1 Tax=Chlorella sorokiniana TaxID=3076 RepID=A0A2P6TK38_CHLSO|nr:transforming growth factor-beta receptor-associated 1 isoform X1 [Chlorella sorokiniana]|eukprot:PRW44437.1 transforming growth factor-beta receptor-associated 1 isoform X1 [Chlorella sorokiniana]
MDAHRRTAFTAALLLDRRQQQGGGGASITAVALSQGGQRLYLGLEDGVLEEHAIHIGPQGARASLAARKHAAKRAIVGIHHLPSLGGTSSTSGGGGGAPAALLVLLTEDGSVLLLDGDSLEGRPLPLRHAVATCMATPPGRPPSLAVALKPSKKALRFVVYELQPSGSSSSSSTPGGGSAAPGSDDGVQWRELFSVPEELAYSPAMLATVPDLGRALLVVGPAGIVVDAAGNPVGSALPLETLGATPRALAASGAFLLVVSEGGIHVFDRESGSEVQRLGFGPTLRPLPGQPLYAATAEDAAAGADGAAAGSGAALWGGGGGVAVAGRRLVWLCLPVSAADQTRELLSQRDYETALDLIEGGLRQGAPWAQIAAAQAALLLLHECRFEEAVGCLERCSTVTFQPAQLFPLFPSYTAPWAQQVPTHQRYWGLHAPLPSLEALISRKLEGYHSQQPANGSSGPVSPAGLPPGSSRSSLFALDSSSAGADSPPTAWPSAGGGKQQQQHHQHPQQGEVQQAEGQNGGLQPPAAGRQLGEAQRAGRPVPDERQRLQRRAWEALAQYLFRVRMLEGVACLPGIDTLLLLLLADLGDARQVAAFAAIPNQVDVAAVTPRLQAEQWHHALATLHAARGAADTALRIWRQVADGQLAAPADPAVQAAERREALESASALLRDPEACPEGTLVSYIPWLLGASQPAALAVLTARSLTPAAVLPLLPAESDVRWQYLAHLVAGSAGSEAAGGSGSSSSAASDPALHTELATQLAAAIQRAEPALCSPLPPGSSPLRHNSTRRSSSGGAPRRRPSRTSTAALVSGGSLEPWEGASPVDAMRLRLRAHLEASSLYDAAAVLACLQGSGLHEELVVLHSKLGDHMAALRLLALTLHDVAAAEAYARAHLPPSDYRALLHLLLEPGPGLEPRWDDACYLIAALGDHLDPQEVLQALPPGMPLEAAAAVLAPMMRDRLHRRRQSCLVKNLHRSRLAAAAGTLCDAQDRRVVVDEERACPHCHLRLGGKVFVVLQSGMLPTAAELGDQVHVSIYNS